MQTKIIAIATLALSFTSHAATVYFKNVGEKPITIKLAYKIYEVHDGRISGVEYIDDIT